jgi:glutamine amidotransferase
MFYLALTFGLESDPVSAVEQMVGFVEETGRKHGVEQPIQMTVATTEGGVSGRSAARARATRARSTSARGWTR